MLLVRMQQDTANTTEKEKPGNTGGSGGHASAAIGMAPLSQPTDATPIVVDDNDDDVSKERRSRSGKRQGKDANVEAN